jgi:hypothetical protein
MWQRSEMYETTDNAQKIATVNVKRDLVQHITAPLKFSNNYLITFFL